MGAADLRGDGPLAQPWPRRVLPVPELALLALGAGLVAVPALIELLTVVTGAGPVVAAPTLPVVLAGVVVALLGRGATPSLRLDWLAPSLLRLLEYAAVAALVAAGPVRYLWLATIAYHHYDLVYRVRTRGVPTPRWLVLGLGGWEGRTLLLLAAAAGGVADLTAVALTVLAGTLLIGETVWSLRRPRPTATATPTYV